MQVVLVKRFEEVRQGEKLVVGNASGQLLAREVIRVAPHDGYAEEVTTDVGTVECDRNAVVLILGEWFS